MVLKLCPCLADNGYYFNAACSLVILFILWLGVCFLHCLQASKPSAKSSAPAKTGKASKAKASAAQEVSLLDCKWSLQQWTGVFLVYPGFALRLLRVCLSFLTRLD